MEQVGRRLIGLRHVFGLSQRELAKRAGVPNSAISVIEQGKSSPSLLSLEKVLNGFPVTLQQFFAFTFTDEDTQRVPASTSAHALSVQLHFGSEPSRVCIAQGTTKILAINEPLNIIHCFTVIQLAPADILCVEKNTPYRVEANAPTAMWSESVVMDSYRF